MIACYGRVSTPEQSLDRQLHNITEVAGGRLGGELEGYTPDEVSEAASKDTLKTPAQFGDVRVYYDKATGTDTQREDFEKLMGDVRAGVLDSVVVHSVSRLARSIRDLSRIVDTVVEKHDTSLHILSEGFDLVPGEDDPYQMAMVQLLGVFAELEAEMTRRRIKEGIQTRRENDDYHHGPAPLGFEKNDGTLTEVANYDQVCAVLDMVDAGEMSQRQAAKRLDCGRKTVRRAINQKPELYGL